MQENLNLQMTKYFKAKNVLSPPSCIPQHSDVLYQFLSHSRDLPKKRQNTEK